MLRFQIIQKERSIPGGCYLKFHPPLHSPSFSFLLSFIFSLFISRQCVCVCVFGCLLLHVVSSSFFFLPFAFSSPSRRWSVQQTIEEKRFRGNWCTTTPALEQIPHVNTLEPENVNDVILPPLPCTYQLPLSFLSRSFLVVSIALLFLTV